MNTNEISTQLSGIVIVSDATKQEIKQLCERSAAVTKVECDAEARVANSVVRDLKSLRKMIETERKSITKVLDDGKKRIMAIEKNAVADLESEAERVGALANSYVERMKAEQEERNKEIQAENMLLGENKEIEAGKAVAGVRSRETWDFEVVNEAEVPREFCEPSSKLIREYIKSVKDGGSSFENLAIPGVKFTKNTTVY